jgi:hypothetical protein
VLQYAYLAIYIRATGDINWKRCGRKQCGVIWGRHLQGLKKNHKNFSPFILSPRWVLTGENPEYGGEVLSSAPNLRDKRMYCTWSNDSMLIQ